LDQNQNSNPPQSDFKYDFGKSVGFRRIPILNPSHRCISAKLDNPSQC